MTIAGFQIRSIVKTYHKNIRWSEKRAVRDTGRSHGSDRVKISVEGRRKQVCQKAANQVIERLTRAKNTKASFPEESR